MLLPRPEYEPLLAPESRIANETCRYILAQLRARDGPWDYSPVIACAFKILEVEIRERAFRSFKDWPAPRLRAIPQPFLDEYSREIGALPLYIRDARPMSLGEMLLVLKHLRGVPAAPDGDIYSQLKAFLRLRCTAPHYFYGKQQLAQRIQRTVLEFRNPAIHAKVFTGDEYRRFHSIFFGTGLRAGVGNLTLRCLMPKQPQSAGSS